MTQEEKVWIGLVSLLPVPGDERCELPQGCIGAFSNVMALAADANEFIARVQRAAIERGFIAEYIEDVEILSERMQHCEVASEVLLVAHRAKTMNSVEFDQLYCYRQEEGEEESE